MNVRNGWDRPDRQPEDVNEDVAESKVVSPATDLRWLENTDW